MAKSKQSEQTEERAERVEALIPGRHVYFTSAYGDREIEPAIIAYVHGESGLANLMVINREGNPRPELGVPYDEHRGPRTWRWMRDA